MLVIVVFPNFDLMAILAFMCRILRLQKSNRTCAGRPVKMGESQDLCTRNCLKELAKFGDLGVLRSQVAPSQHIAVLLPGRPGRVPQAITVPAARPSSLLSATNLEATTSHCHLTLLSLAVFEFVCLYLNLVCKSFKLLDTEQVRDVPWNLD